MRLFNAIQLVLLFAILPFALYWLYTAVFTFAAALFWIGAIVYVVLFVWMIYMVYANFCDWNKS